ncbi:polyphosphate kinase 2 family protein [Mucilaginibacter sp. L3T2-6]|uniref:polyphosphate kinase 2 family protein n=1 Tax=Mucilaginibacter sp. L3T2-6 TaxID=3062491 RepID=UPI002674AD1D|nr:polyphosphate kinase 2 family protein [Mucilaginibacter sp. L3T2-6]MDO3641177.1 polyphosphate kinase 2 family protein [Mucilaginibacter sp. L3T2-6]MDV6213347.1 polyphosphate kinase 2 family protein [Mucilaginibacter sp. L3T2-6]
MNNLVSKFKITEKQKFSLKDHDPGYADGFEKSDAKNILASLIKETSWQQAKLYADNRRSVLIIFQAMDAAGKDGAIAHTMSGLNPQGCEVYSFKQPTAEDYDHDFLWRHHNAMPERGRIGIHNRSHYEYVLVTKVHPELLLKEQLPGINDVKDLPKGFWEDRYESIRAFEKHLWDSGTVIIKFFLHLSRAEQEKRFLKRIEDPKRNWKFSPGDIVERSRWADYMDAYEKAIRETSTKHAPWYVIPADKKWFTRIAISTIILETMKSLDLKFPVLEKAEMDKLEEAKNKLLSE